MLILLVFLILVVLIFGASALLYALIGVVSWVIGIIAVLAIAVWGASTFDIDVGIVILAVIFGPILGLLTVSLAAHYAKERNFPANQKTGLKGFLQELKQHQK